MLFDKVMEVAMEFSGSGPVEGPGSEVSDSVYPQGYLMESLSLLQKL